MLMIMVLYRTVFIHSNPRCKYFPPSELNRWLIRQPIRAGLRGSLCVPGARHCSQAQ